MKRPGYIYILINPSLKGMVKIGKTTRSPDERATEISQGSGVPTPYWVVYEELVSGCDLAESLVHQKLSKFRVNEDREFFAVPLKKAIRVVADVVQKMPWVSTERIEGIDNDNLRKILEDLGYLKKGSNVNYQDENGISPLMKTGLENDIDAVRILIYLGADLDLKNNQGETALIKAASKGHSSIVTELLKNGVNVNARTNSGVTALMLTSYGEHTETVRVFAIPR